MTTTGRSDYVDGSTEISARARSGSVTINADTVSPEADLSNGIQAVAFGAGATVDVTAGSITTAGNNCRCPLIA